MFLIMYSLIVLSISVFAFAEIYLYIFRKTHEKYIGFWGLSWMIYGLGLLLDILIYNNIPISYIFIAQQLIYSLSIFLMLSGTYAFIHKKVPRKFLLIIACNFLWGVFCLLFQYSYLVTVFPLSMSFSILSIYTGMIFLQNWEFEGIEKIITGVFFLLWGVHKLYYLYLHPNFTIFPSGYITEILLIIVLNSCLILSYLQKNRIHLVKNEQIFRLLTENSQDLIYLCKYTPEPYFEYVSPNCEKILGYSQENFYANPYLLDDIVHIEDKQLFELTLNPKLSPKESVTLRYRHKEGHYLWVEEYTTLIYDKEGNLFGIEGIIRDNTEKILVSKEVQKTEKERQKLLSTISHELKTPITTIQGYVDAILDNKIPPGESQRYLKNIQNKVTMLDHLINDLFELSQFESNQIQFKFSQITAEELMVDIYNKFFEDIHHVGLRFELNIDCDIVNSKVEIIADRERILQVFFNLIYNAIKYTPPGGKISVSCTAHGGNQVLIAVSDTGNGILEADLPHVFERFYRGSHSAVYSKQGGGLGLAISKEIIIKHNGRITVESEPGRGTTFQIFLPASNIMEVRQWQESIFL